jgi:hypothetical protein
MRGYRMGRRSLDVMTSLPFGVTLFAADFTTATRLWHVLTAPVGYLSRILYGVLAGMSTAWEMQNVSKKNSNT